MNRRDFLTGAAYLGSWLAVGAHIPKLIGEQAGGFYAPIPDDLTEYVTWMDGITPANTAAELAMVRMSALWAPPGAEFAAIAEFAGTYLMKPTDTPRERDARRSEIVSGMRDCLAAHHEPGWFKARLATEFDDNDQIVAGTGGEAWKRAGYVKWLTRAEWNQICRMNRLTIPVELAA